MTPGTASSTSLVALVIGMLLTVSAALVATTDTICRAVAVRAVGVRVGEREAGAAGERAGHA